MASYIYTSYLDEPPNTFRLITSHPPVTCKHIKDTIILQLHGSNVTELQNKTVLRSFVNLVTNNNSSSGHHFEFPITF